MEKEDEELTATVRLESTDFPQHLVFQEGKEKAFSLYGISLGKKCTHICNLLYKEWMREPLQVHTDQELSHDITNVEVTVNACAVGVGLSLLSLVLPLITQDIVVIAHLSRLLQRVLYTERAQQSLVKS